MPNMCYFQVTISDSLTFSTHKVDILTDLFLFVLPISSQYVSEEFVKNQEFIPLIYGNINEFNRNIGNTKINAKVVQ